MSEPKDIESLRWIRLLSPEVIPKYLVEQVRDRQYTVEDFYKYQAINCMNDNSVNPLNHLLALADKNNFVKGFLWFVVDPLTKNVFINTFSIDKEYWYNGQAVKHVKEYMKNILKKVKLGRAYWVTRYPKHSLRHGFKRSAGVLMEYNLGEEEDGRHIYGVNKAQGRSKHVDTGTAVNAESNVRTVGTAISGGNEPVSSA